MTKDNYEDILMDVGSKQNDVKWNIFRFQDHLKDWIDISARCFFTRDYPSAFEALQNLYADTNGFYAKEEITELDGLYKKAYNTYVEYTKYNINYQNIKSRIKTQTYIPPKDLYFSLIDFRFKLMKYMAKHQLLIQTVKKGIAGAGSQM